MTLSTRTAAFSSVLTLSLGAAFFGGLIPDFAAGQALPTGQIVINTQVGVGAPSAFPNGTVTVTASGPSLSGTPTSVGTLTYNSNFANDTKVVTAVPGPYAVTAAPSQNYTASYSQGCTGVLMAGSTVTCTVIASQYVSGASMLTVYTRVTNTRGGTYQPSSFQIQVSGQNPSLSNFSGSSGGTVVALGAGSFSVNAPSVGGYTASLSGACSGTIQTGQSLSCAVTYSDAGFNPFPGQGLICTPPNQTAALGQTVTFNAYGGSGTYTWKTVDRTYLNIGPTLTTSLQSAGAQSVMVTSGTQTAVCTVNVSGIYAYAPNPNYYTGYNPGGGYVLGAYTQAPGLPNTGFEPIDWMSMLLGLFSMAVVGTYLYWYGSKRFFFAR